MKSFKDNLQERIAFLKLKAGDSDAFAFFYDKYVSRIYRFVMIKVSNKQIAEDLTQDIFLKIWQHLVDKRHIKNFQAFIFRIARNAVIDHYRRSNRQELPLDYIFETNNYLTDKTITNLDKSLDADNLLRQLSQLKPEYQEILLLRYVEDLSIEDISQIIEKDKNNVRVILHRALNKLKEITEK
ncbi:MAG: hypothetical protein COV55_01100 [Candidatus Komeilibacteria bacterium CG11_big_fil_rev_8_21_14_0_20_36_20]|uniref:RNA polymerase sigma factor n=1 Tax=Candidatus Komeilibacteria bacterium CG11_big_fil_rev_8_21_14_0_20_36_20 TaxID=1974477 RepID=A0A2H0NG04_9BACT|nr:MAG: hypothetical protein COV55_01100 [Candidatus Komeilibacteria bacterium CG11_big_fil_rev_8_21_14_0_20_36_20]PIR81377.1 MAG: hypothetical protein COU21_04070 [Candidatus Komeilibacteria bacterium CG10_big_fil_rev_8_21_14_0_10_36_65]PJC55102.1 MAG: hypothetical protein CO027_03025 [Candidatus Komeilibacteria bacterium CG_4_9_14_0_2_um_filter_36_13]